MKKITTLFFLIMTLFPILVFGMEGKLSKSRSAVLAKPNLESEDPAAAKLSLKLLRSRSDLRTSSSDKPSVDSLLLFLKGMNAGGKVTRTPSGQNLRFTFIEREPVSNPD